MVKRLGKKFVWFLKKIIYLLCRWFVMAAAWLERFSLEICNSGSWRNVWLLDLASIWIFL